VPRISFVLLFGVGTTIENFQDKLPRAVLRMITAEQFDVAQSEKVLEDVFCRTTIGPSTKLRIGPSLSQMLLDRSNEQIMNVEDFADALQVIPLTW